MRILLATEQWPVVFAKLDGEQTVADLQAHFAEFEAVLGRKQRFAQITWLKSYSRDPELNKTTAKWFKQREKAMKETCVGVAHISSSLGFRFVLSTVFLLKPLPVPYTVSPSFADAMEFVRGQASKYGLALPADVKRPWADMP